MAWREMRFWIETGFNALKSAGWRRRKTRRTDPARVERHWLDLSVATPLTARLRQPRGGRPGAETAPERNRIASVFRLGMAALSRLLTKGRMRLSARLLPEP